MVKKNKKRMKSHKFLVDKKKIIRNHLKSIKGIGDSVSRFYCKEFGYRSDSVISAFSNKQRSVLFNFIEDKKVIPINEENSNISKERIRKLIDIRLYRGLRHKAGLPVRGQRTHTNRKTSRKLNKTRF